MKKILRYSIISSSLFLIGTTNAFAQAYQIFAPMNFANPATLQMINQDEIILGNATVFGNFQFSGAANGVQGTTSSNTLDFLPYGRFAKRLTPKIVVSLDITQPYFTNIQYPTTSFADTFSTTTIVRDVNYSPKVSYKVNDRLSVGLGFDANNMYNAQLNFDVPPLGNLKNEANSWAYGWDIGLSYAVTPITFLNLNYYSQIIQHLEGTSYWGTITAPGTSADVVLPATWIANVVQILPPNWLLSGTLRYAQWDSFQYVNIQHSAIGLITVPEHYYNNISAELAARYQINTKWAAIGAVDYEPNTQPEAYRGIGLPTDTRYGPTIGAEYQFIKGFKAKLMYSYIHSRAPIDLTNASGTIQGTETVNVNVVDLSFTYDV